MALEICSRGPTPLSVFLGRTVQPGDPLWLPDDTDKALAYEVAKGQACRTCRTRDEDWLDDEGLPLDPPKLMTKPATCEGCAEIARTRAAIEQGVREAHGTGHEADHLIDSALAGLSISLVPFEYPHDDVEED